MENRLLTLLLFLNNSHSDLKALRRFFYFPPLPAQAHLTVQRNNEISKQRDSESTNQRSKEKSASTQQEIHFLMIIDADFWVFSTCFWTDWSQQSLPIPFLSVFDWYWSSPEALWAVFRSDQWEESFLSFLGERPVIQFNFAFELVLDLFEDLFKLGRIKQDQVNIGIRFTDCPANDFAIVQWG